MSDVQRLRETLEDLARWLGSFPSGFRLRAAEDVRTALARLERLDELEKENVALKQDRFELRESLERIAFKSETQYAPEVRRYAALDWLAHAMLADASAARNVVTACWERWQSILRERTAGAAPVDRETEDGR
jgi:hypothetical protein